MMCNKNIDNEKIVKILEEVLVSSKGGSGYSQQLYNGSRIADKLKVLISVLKPQ